MRDLPEDPLNSSPSYRVMSGLMLLDQELARRAEMLVSDPHFRPTRPAAVQTELLTSLSSLLGPDWASQEALEDRLLPLLTAGISNGPRMEPGRARAIIAAARVLADCRLDELRPGDHPVFGPLEPGRAYPVGLHADVHRAAQLWKEGFVEPAKRERNVTLLQRGLKKPPLVEGEENAWMNDVINLDRTLRNLAAQRAAGKPAYFDPHSAELNELVLSVADRAARAGGSDRSAQLDRHRLLSIRYESGRSYFSGQRLDELLTIATALRQRGPGYNPARGHPLVGRVDDASTYARESERELAIAAAAAWEHGYLEPQQNRLAMLLKTYGLQDPEASLRPRLTLAPKSEHGGIQM